MKRLNLMAPDYSFAFPYYAPKHQSLEAKQDLLHSFLSSVKPGTTELHFHPCVESEQLKLYNPFWENRIHEYLLLKTINADVLMREYGIELISYCQL